MKIVITALCLLLILLLSCGMSGGRRENQMTTVRVEALETGNISNWASGFTQIESEAQILLYGNSSSTVETILVSQGDSVHKGDLLAVLSTDTLARAGTAQASANLSAARASYDSALDNFERVEALYKAGARSEQEMIGALNMLRNAEASVQSFQAAFSGVASQNDNSLLTAPFDGIIGRIWVREGNIPGNNPVLSIYGGDRLEAWVLLPENTAGMITTGDPAKIDVSGIGETFSGTVESVSPMADPISGHISVKVIVSDPDGLIIPGMSATVRICMNTFEQAIVVPESALVPSTEGYSVALARGATASMVPIVTGIRENGLVQILEGLEAGDQVIVSGGQMVSDGGYIRIEGQAPSGPPGPGMR